METIKPDFLDLAEVISLVWLVNPFQTNTNLEDKYVRKSDIYITEGLKWH